ncbi:M28 family peptidase [Rubritalea tangerina]|uniref:M28 family peptidase n=1 Tax=Rubritalea tangerina TaxID=430798 RepID=A0ABW4ZAG6_9BACT
MKFIARHLLLCSFVALAAGCKDASPSISAPPSEPKPSLGSPQVADSLAQKAYRHTEKILSFGHRQPASPGLRKSKQYVSQQLKKHGWTTVEQSFTAQTPKGPLQYSNLIARYSPSAGHNPWARSCTGVLAAHIDSKILPNFLGADDAASAVGTLIALAEHLDKHHPQVAKEIELVFFDGEEAVGPGISFQKDGLFGSIYYSRAVQSSAAQQVAPYKKLPRFGIVLDMIGHQDLDIKIPSDTPKSLLRDYKAARTKLGFEKHFGFSSGVILDDHYPMNVIANIPTIDLIGDFNKNSWWHTSNDTLDIISKESLSMSIQMTLEILSNQL